MIEFPELKDDEILINQVDIEFYTNQVFEEWKKLNNLTKKSEIVGTLLGVMNGEKPYFHIEWIMDRVFKLTPEEKAENQKYWAKDAVTAAAATAAAPEGGGEAPVEGAEGGEAPAEGGEAPAAPEGGEETPPAEGGGEAQGGGGEFEF